MACSGCAHVRSVVRKAARAVLRGDARRKFEASDFANNLLTPREQALKKRVDEIHARRREESQAE